MNVAIKNLYFKPKIGKWYHVTWTMRDGTAWMEVYADAKRKKLLHRSRCEVVAESPTSDTKALEIVPPAQSSGPDFSDNRAKLPRKDQNEHRKPNTKTP